MSDPNGNSYDAKFDGQDYPIQGDPTSHSLKGCPFVLAFRQKCTTEPQTRHAGYLLVDVSKQQLARLMLRAT